MNLRFQLPGVAILKWETKMRNILGQSLFEVVVAIAMISLITVAIVGLATVSVRNSSFSEEKTSANFYAQEAVEWLRRYRDEQGWFDFSQKGGTWCFPTVATNDTWEDNSEEGTCNNSTPGDHINNTVFLREVTLTVNTGDLADTIDVDVDVSWGTHNAKISTSFSKWEVAP